MLRLRHSRIKKFVQDHIGSKYIAGITTWAFNHYHLPTCDIWVRETGDHSTQGHIQGGSFIEDRDQLQRIQRKVMGWWGSEYQAIWGTRNFFFTWQKSSLGQFWGHSSDIWGRESRFVSRSRSSQYWGICQDRGRDCPLGEGVSDFITQCPF